MVRLRAFGGDDRGVVAVILAIAILPLIGAVGMAIDYSLATRQRVAVQSALDIAVLAGVTAGTAALEDGAGRTTAVAAAEAAARSSFEGNLGTAGPAAMTVAFDQSGLRITGTGTATSSVQNTFMKIFGTDTTAVGVTSEAVATAQPYLDVYLLIDVSASMLLPSTSEGIDRMIAGQGCALACHDRTDGSDSYGWATAHGIQLRYQVVNQGIQNLLDYLRSGSGSKGRVRVELWSFDHAMRKVASRTASYSAISRKFPSPSLAATDASAATPFNSLIDTFVADVGTGGDGSSPSNAQKMVILATDGVNDPTRGWTSNPALRPQVRVFDTAFCNRLKKNGVTLAIINTPYYPMTWDWGYNETLGQPGSLGGSTRVDDIPIALKSCAGSNYLRASEVGEIEAAFTRLFVNLSPTRLTN